MRKLTDRRLAMASQITVHFDGASKVDQLVHRIRNWGEELYLGLRDERWAFVSMDDIDRATDRIAVVVFHARDLNKVRSAIDATLASHMLNLNARVEVSSPGQPSDV